MCRGVHADRASAHQAVRSSPATGLTSPAAGAPALGQAAGDRRRRWGPQIAKTFGPTLGDGACAHAPGGNEPGTVNYRLPAARRGWYVFMGSPTVIRRVQGPLIAGRGVGAPMADPRPT
jgi:hypothetical protein